jgi:hypothetical protein
VHWLFWKRGEWRWYFAFATGYLEWLKMDQIAQYTLHNWIIVCSSAYMEYTFVPWLGRNVYRRTVDYGEICLQ